MRGDDRHAASRHAGEEERRAVHDFNHHEAAFELLGAVLDERRPVRRARNERLQRGEHLAAVARTEGEGVAAREELFEFGAHPRVVQDGRRPAAPGAEHVAIGKAAARDDALEAAERMATGEKIGHVHVERLEARTVERRRHLHLAIDALLAQDGDARPRAAGNGDRPGREREMER